MRVQVASGRNQLPLSISNFATASGSQIAAVNLHFAIQGRNAVGRNQISSIVGPVSVGVGQKLVVTLPSGYILPGEYWDEVVLSASATGSPGTFSQVATAAASKTAPIVFELVNDQLALNAIVSAPSALPANPLPGMLRGVTSLSTVFEFQAGSDLPANGSTVLSAVNGGRWVLKPDGFLIEIDDPEDLETSGCDRDIRSLPSGSITPSAYAADGSVGDGMVFWLLNDTDAAIPSGQRVMVSVSLNGIPRSDLFSGLLKMAFLGYAQPSGQNRTEVDSIPFTGLGQELYFENRKTDFFLIDDLQPGEAYTLKIAPNFRPEYLNHQVPEGAILEVMPSLASQAGSYDESGEALGDRILATYDRGVCVPAQGAAVNCLKRSGVVNSRSFRGVAATTVTGFLANQSNQEVRINGNGVVYRGTAAITEFEAVRAKISCNAGVGFPSSWSEPVTLTSQGLEIECSYPSNGETATVRPDYPDPLIAGNTKAKLNATAVTLYVELVVNSEAQIYRIPDLSVADAESQSFSVLNLNAADLLTAPLPAPGSADFGLFEALSATPTAITGGAITGQVRVAYAFQYDGTVVSKITHDRTQGCIHTSILSLADVEASSQYWAPAVVSLSALRGIPQANVIPWQTRRVVSEGDAYFFDPLSMGVDGNGSSDEKYIRPTWVDLSSPGRFVRDDSSVWLSGLTTPANSLGEVGTYYLRSDGQIFKKTAPTVWASQFKLKGTISYYGDALPDSELGDDGDIYYHNPSGVAYSKDTDWEVAFIFRNDFKLRNDDPAPSFGKVGDVVVNYLTWQYWEKTVSGWVSRGFVRGADGSTIYPLATSSPNSSVGADGDWGINFNNGDLLFKSGGDWSVIGNIKGPQGDPGGGGGGGGVSADGITLNTQFTFPDPLDPGQAGLYVDSNGLLRLVYDGGESEFAYIDRLQTFTKSQRSVVYELTNAAGIVEIDLTQSNYYKIALQDDAEFTLGSAGLTEGVGFSVEIQWGSGDFAPATGITFSIDFNFQNGQAPVIPLSTPIGTKYVLSCVNYSGDFLCTFVGPF